MRCAAAALGRIIWGDEAGVVPGDVAALVPGDVAALDAGEVAILDAGEVAILDAGEVAAVVTPEVGGLLRDDTALIPQTGSPGLEGAGAGESFACFIITGASDFTQCVDTISSGSIW